MYIGDYYVETCIDNGIERTNKQGKIEICNGWYCICYKSYEDACNNNPIDDFCLAVGYDIKNLSDSELERGLYDYLIGGENEND